jgi:hypothetical protein
LLEALADALLEHETLETTEIQKIIAQTGETATIPDGRGSMAGR